MLVKCTSRVVKIFIGDTWDYDGALLNWKVPARHCLMMRGYSGGRVSSRGVRGNWEDLREILERAVELDPRDIELLRLGVAGNYFFLRRYAESNRGWPAHWLSNLTMPLRKVMLCGRRL